LHLSHPYNDPNGGMTRQWPDASKKLLRRRAFEKVAVGRVISDAEERTWEGNSALRRMLGYDEVEFRGIARFNFTLPEGTEKDAELYRELVRGERQNFQWKAAMSARTAASCGAGFQ
jgi:PAS domain S-box-containing protein